MSSFGLKASFLYVPTLAKNDMHVVGKGSWNDLEVGMLIWVRQSNLDSPRTI